MRSNLDCRRSLLAALSELRDAADGCGYLLVDLRAMVSGFSSVRAVASRRFVSEACRRRVLAHVCAFTVHGRSVLILACNVLVLVCMCSYTILGRRMRIPCSGSALEDEKRPILRSRSARVRRRTREGAPHTRIVKSRPDASKSGWFYHLCWAYKCYSSPMSTQTDCT